MATTLPDFYTLVLRELNVVPTNGSATQGDLDRVSEAYPMIHAMLLSLGIVRWGVTESIPAQYVVPMTKIVAYPLTSKFSLPVEHVARLKAEGELGAVPPSSSERQLRKMIADDYIAEPIKNEFI